jgi:hypothetical protein
MIDLARGYAAAVRCLMEIGDQVITCGGVATSLQFPSIVRTELLTPLPYRLIGPDDSALGEKILDIPEADAEW